MSLDEETRDYAFCEGCGRFTSTTIVGRWRVCDRCAPAVSL